MIKKKEIVQAIQTGKLLETIGNHFLSVGGTVIFTVPVEALPQLVIATLWLNLYGELEGCKEAAYGDGEVLDCATKPIVSLCFSACSFLAGVVGGCRALRKFCKSET